MRGKAFITQSMAILLEQATTLDELERHLALFDVIAEHRYGPHWPRSGPSVTVSFRPEVHGVALVDVSDHPWPTTMGSTGSMVFSSWLSGDFGPFAYPGSLVRAVEQAEDWPEASEAVARHTAFVRIRSSYAADSARNDPRIPHDYAPLAELEFLTRVALALSDLPGALCYFDPNGEVLCDLQALHRRWTRYIDGGVRPLALWCHQRLSALPGLRDWLLLDTVGAYQLDHPDVEACFPRDRFERGAIAAFLRDRLTRIATGDTTIADGSMEKGPGDILWRASLQENSLVLPQRRVIRWWPAWGGPAPGELYSAPPILDVARQYQPITCSIAETVRRVLQLLANQDYRGLERLSNGRSFTAEQLREVLEETYKTQIGMPPDDELEGCIDAVRVWPSDPAEWNVDVDLRTAEGERSDLTLQLHLTESGAELCDLVITDLHVL